MVDPLNSQLFVDPIPKRARRNIAVHHHRVAARSVSARRRGDRYRGLAMACSLAKHTQLSSLPATSHHRCLPSASIIRQLDVSVIDL
jgi:hypothetical protein